MKGYSGSLRRACRLLELNTSSYYYQTKPSNDEALRKALKELASRRRRWGYRMLTCALRRKGFSDNHKRIYRIYREEGLQVPKRRKRKTAQWRGEKSTEAEAKNDRWSMDFVSDQLANGRRFRTLNIVDDYSRICVGQVVE